VSGTSNPVPPSRRSPLSSLTPRGRAVLAVGAASVVALGLVVAVPHGAADPAAAAAAAVEREVVTEDVDLSADLVGQRTVLASTGRTRVTVTGIVTAPASSRPQLRPGYKGAAVAFVQRTLHVTPTGWYGPRTLAAVVAFQKAHGLPAKGLVGPRTWAALLAPRGKAAAPRAAKATVRKAAPAAPAAPVTAGRVCPAPGASFGQGWGAARAGHSHKGMDLMGRRGMPLLAIEAGVVVREGRQSNGALRIVLQGRSGSKFYYGHMSKDLVHAGSRVKRGQVIGLMGDSGSPGAVHLHFEFWRSGGESAAVDPAPLLRSLC
jgi:murein DD-endopeptidase MepM/ murein hydrolase activator NlpD